MNVMNMVNFVLSFYIDRKGGLWCLLSRQPREG
jgi:hypothetical protein